PNVTRWAPADSHSHACAKLSIENYTLRDSRHTFAVNSAKAGIPAEFIAQQLGHADTQMVNKVYSRFTPSRAEMAQMFERADVRARPKEEATT
ncbi:MAG: tyrosine-type recombinase/integrase, partial [Gemmatimonadales bacterium]